MLLTAAISFLAGSLVGLRFNVKAVGLSAVAAILFFGAEALSGQMSAGTAVASAAIAVVLLQVGYFSAVVLTAMGYAPITAPRPASGAAASHARRQRSNG